MELSNKMRNLLAENHSVASLASLFDMFDEIRESGDMNMMGLANTLRASGFSTMESRALARAWMKTYDGMSTPERRARLTLHGPPRRPRKFTITTEE
jgi:hypothetical protein